MTWRRIQEKRHLCFSLHSMNKRKMIIPILSICFALRCSAAENEFSVYPTILEERTTSGNLVLHLTDEITLNLQKSSVLADKLIFVTDSKDGNQVDAVDTYDVQKNLYRDSHHHSSLMVVHRNGTVQVEGVVNRKLRIKPLPETERSMEGKIVHSVYEVQEVENGIDKIAKVFPRYASAKYRRHVENFVVELHVVFEKEHLKHFSTDKDLMAYLAVTINAGANYSLASIQAQTYGCKGKLYSFLINFVVKEPETNATLVQSLYQMS